MQRSNQRACTRIDRVCEQRREPGGVWRGRKQGDWARKRDRGSQPIRLSFPFSLSFIYLFFSLLSPFGARVVHFLLSKIMTMLIFLTREEFFKLTCNQTGPRVFRWARRWRRRRRRRTGDGGPHEGSKSSTYEPRYSTGNPFSTAIPTVLSSPPRFSKKHLPDSKLSDRRNFIISENNSLELTAIKFPMKFRNYIYYIYKSVRMEGRRRKDFRFRSRNLFERRDRTGRKE